MSTKRKADDISGDRKDNDCKPSAKVEKLNTTTTTNEKSDNSNEKASSKRNDFVIREGFPALRLPRKATESEEGTTSSEIQPPWIDGDEPLPRHLFWAHDETFQFPEVASLAKLRADCQVVFSARTRDNDEAYSAGVTYFIPSQMKPRCALEAMALEIFQKHTSCLAPGVVIPQQSGAEWWTLVLDDELQRDEDKKLKGSDEDQDEEDDEEESDEVGLHFDADYGLEDQAPNLFLHPRVATVTYLSDCGAPTLVLNRKSPPPNDVEKKELAGTVSMGWLSHPKTGKHIAFDGRLLHGAPATFFPGKETNEASTQKMPASDEPPPAKKGKIEETSKQDQRITLLVNVWVNHCPLDAEPLEDEVCQQLQSSWKKDEKTVYTWNQKADLDSLPKLEQVTLSKSEEDPAGEEEVVISNRYVTAKYEAAMEDLHKISQQLTSSGELHFENHSLVLEVGGEVPEEAEESDE